MSDRFKSCVALSGGILYEFDVADRSVCFGCGLLWVVIVTPLWVVIVNPF